MKGWISITMVDLLKDALTKFMYANWHAEPMLTMQSVTPDVCNVIFTPLCNVGQDVIVHNENKC